MVEVNPSNMGYRNRITHLIYGAHEKPLEFLVTSEADWLHHA
jgi:hypothetical protein